MDVTTSLPMVNAYVSHETIEGYHTGFVIDRGEDGAATLFLPSVMGTAPVEADRMAKASPVGYRPALTRQRLVLETRAWRRMGR